MTALRPGAAGRAPARGRPGPTSNYNERPRPASRTLRRFSPGRPRGPAADAGNAGSAAARRPFGSRGSSAVRYRGCRRPRRARIADPVKPPAKKAPFRPDLVLALGLSVATLLVFGRLRGAP